MSNSTFKASQWLQSINSPKNSGELITEAPPEPLKVDNFFARKDAPKEDFKLSQFIVPEWNGEGLLSKDALYVRKQIYRFCQDARKQLESFSKLNQTLRQKTHQDFLKFIQDFDDQNQYADLQHAKNFWQHFSLEDSKHSQILDKFKDVYCFRSVTLFLLKMRFISNLGPMIGINLTQSNYQNPGAFLAKLFKHGGSNELHTHALKQNRYSWFRPSSEVKDNCKKIACALSQLSISEILKVFSSSNLGSEEESLYFKDNDFSHALSHKSFGLLLNALIINYPLWKSSDFDQAKSCAYRPSHYPLILRALFNGDHLSSIVHSHWLAQENNVWFKWDELICSNFIGSSYETNSFFNDFHELQYITFLLEVAKNQSYDPIKLISFSMKEKYNKSTGLNSGQMDIFRNTNHPNELKYNIVVSLNSQANDANSHHKLIQKLQVLEKKLDYNARVYVLSNQNLFVPSQHKKVGKIMESMEIESIIDFANLTGKGELPDYLYILKRKGKSSEKQNIAKQSCFNFRFRGDLKRFSCFTTIVQAINNFFLNKDVNNTSIYQQELENELSFEFHQDVVLDGKLLSSFNKEESSTAHPHFFKNVTKNCIPLDHFFNIEKIEAKALKPDDNTSFGIPYRLEDHYPYLIVLDYSKTTHVDIELAPMSTYKKKVSDYGNAYFQYFGAIPKRMDMDLNVFREYFKSKIGKQIVQLTLNGGMTKTKAKLNSLLIPKFFILENKMSSYLESSLGFLMTSQKGLGDMHPEAVKNSFDSIKDILPSVSKSYPWHLLSYLAYFKYNLNELMISSRENKSSEYKINFQNPFIMDELIKLETQPMYPMHPDIFIEFCCKDSHHLNSPLAEVKLIREGENDALIFRGPDLEIFKIFANRTMLDFIKFLCQSALGQKVSDILRGLNIPTEENLLNIVKRGTEIEKTYKDIFDEVHHIIEDTLIKNLN